MQFNDISGVSSISTSYSHTIVLKNDGTVWGWGDNGSGQLGNGTDKDSITPVQAKGLSGISAIATNHKDTIALKSDGTIWIWGDAGGSGTSSNITTPVSHTNLTGVVQIASGGPHVISIYYIGHKLALKSDGTVWAWGNNSVGQLGYQPLYPDNYRDNYGPVQVDIPTGMTPTVATGSASLIATDSATLDGTVNPNGSATTWYFQYGTTTNYGSLTSIATLGSSGSTSETVSSRIMVLEENTTYHFRLVAANSTGTTYGNDKTFTTTGENTTEDRYDEGYEAGKKYCEDNPAACGISTGGGYTQADLDAKYKEGYNAGSGSCSNGSSSPATISAALDLHIPQLNYSTAFGVMALWADFKYVGESNGELLWKLSDFGQKSGKTAYKKSYESNTTRLGNSGDRYDEGYEAGKQYCKNNPAGCGISTSGGYTQADLDAKYKEGYNAGSGSCSNGSSSPATISAALDLHIPQLNYSTAFGVMALWADFKYVGESNGELIWKLSDFGQK
ncbi:MAG: hypothetical protein HQK63_11015 [Desulfamplus sp.]|nr:hypothetical protein [Desulfamplus sp.]